MFSKLQLKEEFTICERDTQTTITYVIKFMPIYSQEYKSQGEGNKGC